MPSKDIVIFLAYNIDPALLGTKNKSQARLQIVFKSENISVILNHTDINLKETRTSTYRTLEFSLLVANNF